jgi:hypothetical protein
LDRSQFYRKLQASSILPETSSPSPGDFRNIPIEEIQHKLPESVQESDIPFHSFGAFALRQTGEPETIDQGIQLQDVAVHTASIKNQVDNSPEANKKSASFRPIPAFLASISKLW